MYSGLARTLEVELCTYVHYKMLTFRTLCCTHIQEVWKKQIYKLLSPYLYKMSVVVCTKLWHLVKCIILWHGLTLIMLVQIVLQVWKLSLTWRSIKLLQCDSSSSKPENGDSGPEILHLFMFKEICVFQFSGPQLKGNSFICMQAVMIVWYQFHFLFLSFIIWYFVSKTVLILNIF